MKKGIALLLALIMALMTVPALAADYTLEEKFIRQVQESGWQGQITFETAGNGTAAADLAGLKGAAAPAFHSGQPHLPAGRGPGHGGGRGGR